MNSKVVQNIARTALKGMNFFDDIGSAVAKKTGSMTIGAAAEGALVNGAIGATIGGIHGAISDDTTVGEGMAKGALIGSVIGGVSQGVLSDYLQKHPRIKINAARAVNPGSVVETPVSMGKVQGLALKKVPGGTSLTAVPEAGVDYSRAFQNGAIFETRTGISKYGSTYVIRRGEGIVREGMSDLEVAQLIAQYR